MFQWWEKHEYIFYCFFFLFTKSHALVDHKLKSIPTTSKYVPMAYQFKFDSEYANV
jgi:hypothetical protein